MAERTTDFDRLAGGAPFTWGKKLHFINIGNHYQILVYIPWREDAYNQLDWTNKQYHVYVDKDDTCESCDTLEEAIVAAIAYKAEGPNHRADYYFNKMIQEVK